MGLRGHNNPGADGGPVPQSLGVCSQLAHATGTPKCPELALGLDRTAATNWNRMKADRQTTTACESNHEFHPYAASART